METPEINKPTIEALTEEDWCELSKVWNASGVHIDRYFRVNQFIGSQIAACRAASPNRDEGC